MFDKNFSKQQMNKIHPRRATTQGGQLRYHSSNFINIKYQKID